MIPAPAPAQVVLVVPPFFGIGRPHLGVSLLKAGLARDGISAVVHYANVDFACSVGSVLTEWIALASPVNQLLGEWVFAHLIGRRELGELDAYVDDVQAYLATGHPGTPAALRRLRDDAEAFVAATAAAILERRPAVVGISTSFQQNCAALALARRIKADAPEVRICLGGANCEAQMGREMLALFDYVDHVFSGECDHAFPARVRGWLDGKESAPAGYTIHRDQCNPARSFTEALPIADLNTVPVPDFVDYFARLAAVPPALEVTPALVVETSRGCWWGAKHHCTFCGLNGQGLAYRAKQPGRVVAETAALVAAHGVTDFLAVDNILAASGTADALAAAAPESPRRFFFEVKSNIGYGQLELLARSGITHVQPGIESLDDHVLQLMRKGVSSAQNIAFLRGCAELGIQPSWNMLFGFPYEGNAPYERMLELIPRIEHLPPPGSWSPVRIDRFSPFFMRPEELGFTDVRPYPSYAAIYDLTEASAARLAYYFTGTPKAIVSLDVLEPFLALVDEWRARYEGDQRAMLTMMPTPSGSMIVDTRGCGVESFHLLTPCEADLLSAAVTPTTREAVLQSVTARRTESPAATEFGPALEALLTAGWLVETGGRLVSVVVRPDRLLLDPTAAAPCGTVASWEPDAVAT